MANSMQEGLERGKHCNHDFDMLPSLRFLFQIKHISQRKPLSNSPNRKYDEPREKEGQTKYDEEEVAQTLILGVVGQFGCLMTKKFNNKAPSTNVNQLSLCLNDLEQDVRSIMHTHHQGAHPHHVVGIGKADQDHRRQVMNKHRQEVLHSGQKGYERFGQVNSRIFYFGILLTSSNGIC